MNFPGPPVIGNGFLTFNQGPASADVPDDVDMFLEASFVESLPYNSTEIFPSSITLNSEALTINSLQHSGAEFWFPIWTAGHDCSQEVRPYCTSTEISTTGSVVPQLDTPALPVSGFSTYSTCPSASYSTDSSPSQSWDVNEEFSGFTQGFGQSESLLLPQTNWS